MKSNKTYYDFSSFEIEKTQLYLEIMYIPEYFKKGNFETEEFVCDAIVMCHLIAPVRQTEKFYAIRREYADIFGQDALLIKIAKVPVIQIATVGKVFV